MRLLESLINGLSMGSTYAMIALGYTMVYGIAKMLNFAHGDIIMMGAYMIWLVIPAGGSPLLAVFAAIVFCVLLGITIEKIAYKPLRGASPLAVLITAIGVSYLLQSVAQILLKSSSHPFLPVELGSITFRGITINVSTLLTLGCSIIIMIALTLFVKFTKTGRAMIAVSEDKGAAQLMGINVNKIIMITFAIGSALAAVASFFYLLKVTEVKNTMGALPGIMAFAAAVIGGIGSIPGAMLGGIIIGIIEGITGTNPIYTSYTVAIEFVVLIIILLVRPAGILGKKRREKV